MEKVLFKDSIVRKPRTKKQLRLREFNVELRILAEVMPVIGVTETEYLDALYIDLVSLIEDVIDDYKGYSRINDFIKKVHPIMETLEKIHELAQLHCESKVEMEISSLREEVCKMYA